MAFLGSQFTLITRKVGLTVPYSGGHPGSSIHLLCVQLPLREIFGDDLGIEVDPSLVIKDEIKELGGSPRRFFGAVGEPRVILHCATLRNIHRFHVVNAALSSVAGS